MWLREFHRNVRYVLAAMFSMSHVLEIYKLNINMINLQPISFLT
jgi:hypothetical protein